VEPAAGETHAEAVATTETSGLAVVRGQETRAQPVSDDALVDLLAETIAADAIATSSSSLADARLATSRKASAADALWADAKW
jgi:hypothetical protein